MKFSPIELAVKGYLALDDALMFGANKAVQAYNWTTGGTKSDLANHMLRIGSILSSVGFIGSAFPDHYEKIPINFLSSIAILGSSHLLQKVNKESEEKENKALRSGALDLYSLDETYNSLLGPSFLTLGSIYFISSGHPSKLSIATPIPSSLAGTGLAITGGSCYIMRANNLPPRENCVKRGLDKLTEIIEDYLPNKQPQPVSVR